MNTLNVKFSTGVLKIYNATVVGAKSKQADGRWLRSRHMTCQQSACGEFPVVHLGFLQYAHYVITARLSDLESFHKRYQIKQVIFYFKTYNPAFTQLEIWFRFIFLMASFVAACMFTHVLRRFPPQDWSLEQKWTSILLPALVFFNNPLFPMSFLVNSSIPGILDAIYQATFLSLLMFFWLSAYHGLRQNDRRLLTFYLPKLIILVPLWLTTIVSAVNQKTEEIDDPTFNYDAQTNHFFGLKVAYAVAGFMYVVYMLLLILRAYSELRSMPFFVSKFSIDALQDNFVADLKTTYTTSAEFMTLYGIINFSLYAMAYVYAPAHSTPIESHITKDNPAFSMINDSDEDVIYGSDEDSRKPLNRSCNHDDSD